jgi:hypothetical protein
MRCDVQDEGLDFISESLDTLKSLAEDMNEVFVANASCFLCVAIHSSVVASCYLSLFIYFCRNWIGRSL